MEITIVDSSPLSYPSYSGSPHLASFAMWDGISVNVFGRLAFQYRVGDVINICMHNHSRKIKDLIARQNCTRFLLEKYKGNDRYADFYASFEKKRLRNGLSNVHTHYNDKFHEVKQRNRKS